MPVCAAKSRMARAGLGFLLLIPAAASAQLPPWASPSGISTSPSQPAPADSVSVRVEGNLPSGCYSTPSIAATRTGASIAVRLNTTVEPGPCTLALVPYDVTTDVGKLAAGNYTVTVTYSENGGPTGAAATLSFSVVAPRPKVSLAAAVILAAILFGIGVLLAIRRRRTNA